MGNMQNSENDFIVAKNPQLDYVKRQLGDNVGLEYRLGLHSPSQKMSRSQKEAPPKRAVVLKSNQISQDP
jgi:hypothetical protein